MAKYPRTDAIVRFLTEEDAATAVEYAVMLALIIAVCLGSISAVASKTAESFNTTESAISGAFGN
jgi:pilus assembly protein Flp/PilA